MDQVSQVRERIDIVSLISEHISLKKTGQNFKALCPFHGEKTPSFVVSPIRQIWHCFGCGKGGDAFSFLMEYENMEFPEALRVLAKRAGVEIIQDRWQTQSSFKKEKIYKINFLAAQFYHYILTQHNVGKKALSYLSKRRINKRIIDTFMLGFAPVGSAALSNYLIGKKQFKKEDIVESGLGLLRNGQIFDFFRERIIFPLFDHRDNVTGFSGRVLDDKAKFSESKYINTRETDVYHKGRAFFGLNIAKDEIKKEKRVIIVEGEFDVLSLFREGIGNAVAVKGTALTDDHIRLISRFADKISICFDQDKAGQDAILRSIPVLEKSALTASVVELSGKDPDEMSSKDPATLKYAIKHDIGLYDFFIKKSTAEFDKRSYEGKKKITDQVLPYLSNIENEIIKDHYLRRLSEELDVSNESVLREINRIEQKAEISEPSFKQGIKRPREEILEEYLLSVILESGKQKQILGRIEKKLAGFHFTTPSFQGIREALVAYFKTNNSFDVKKFVNTLSNEYLGAFDACFLLPYMDYLKDRYSDEACKAADELRMIYAKKIIRDLGEKIKAKEKEGTDEEIRILQKKLVRMISLLQASVNNVK